MGGSEGEGGKGKVGERGEGSGERGRGDEYLIFAFLGCNSTSVLLIRNALSALSSLHHYG